MSNLFEFKAGDYAEQFKDQGYVVIRNAVSRAFFDHAVREVDRCMRAEDISRSKRRLKREYLFNFPDDRLIYELVTTLGELTGLPGDELIISERHIKVYRDDAPQNPLPHKDRRGTQLAVGVPIEIPDDSRLILYPHADRSENEFDSYDEFLASLPEAELPENILKNISPLVIDTRPGDLIVFYGSTIWHERTNAAGAKLLYFKMNAVGSNPLGENLPGLPLRKRWEAAGVDADKAQPAVAA